MSLTAKKQLTFPSRLIWWFGFYTFLCLLSIRYTMIIPRNSPSTVTCPRYADFYLLAHKIQIGTARSRHCGILKRESVALGSAYPKPMQRAQTRVREPVRHTTSNRCTTSRSIGLSLWTLDIPRYSASGKSGHLEL